MGYKVEIKSGNTKWNEKKEIQKVGILQIFLYGYGEQLGYVDNSTKNSTNARPSPISSYLYYYIHTLSNRKFREQYQLVYQPTIITSKPYYTLFIPPYIRLILQTVGTMNSGM